MLPSRTTRLEIAHLPGCCGHAHRRPELRQEEPDPRYRISFRGMFRFIDRTIPDEKDTGHDSLGNRPNHTDDGQRLLQGIQDTQSPGRPDYLPSDPERPVDVGGNATIAQSPRWQSGLRRVHYGVTHPLLEKDVRSEHIAVNSVLWQLPAKSRTNLRGSIPGDDVDPDVRITAYTYLQCHDLVSLCIHGGIHSHVRHDGWGPDCLSGAYRFTPDRLPHYLSLCSLGFGISIVLSFLIHLCVPFVDPFIENTPSFIAVLSLVLNFCVISVPFISAVSASAPFSPNSLIKWASSTRRTSLALRLAV